MILIYKQHMYYVGYFYISLTLMWVFFTFLVCIELNSVLVRPACIFLIWLGLFADKLLAYIL